LQSEVEKVYKKPGKKKPLAETIAQDATPPPPMLGCNKETLKGSHTTYSSGRQKSIKCFQLGGIPRYWKSTKNMTTSLNHEKGRAARTKKLENNEPPTLLQNHFWDKNPGGGGPERRALHGTANFSDKKKTGFTSVFHSIPMWKSPFQGKGMGGERGGMGKPGTKKGLRQDQNLPQEGMPERIQQRKEQVI